MARACTICTHPSRDAIERAILAGQPIRRIAANYGLSESAVRRHRNTHLRDVLALSKQAAETARAEKLVEFILFVRNEAIAVYREARKAKRLGVALQALAEARESTAMLAKLAGGLGDRIEVSFTDSREWQEIRNLILDTLEPYPEIRAFLSEVLLRKYGQGNGDGH